MATKKKKNMIVIKKGQKAPKGYHKANFIGAPWAPGALIITKKNTNKKRTQAQKAKFRKMKQENRKGRPPRGPGKGGGAGGAGGGTKPTEPTAPSTQGTGYASGVSGSGRFVTERTTGPTGIGAEETGPTTKGGKTGRKGKSEGNKKPGRKGGANPVIKRAARKTPGVNRKDIRQAVKSRGVTASDKKVYRAVRRAAPKLANKLKGMEKGGRTESKGTLGLPVKKKRPTISYKKKNPPKTGRR